MLRREFVNGILAGLCISLGGGVYLSCDNKYIGALLFCVALFSICVFGFSLYTGKVGYMVESHKKTDFLKLFAGLLGNTAGCFIFGVLFRLGVDTAVKKVEEMCTTKLQESFVQALIRAFFCGVLMYIAVRVYKNKDSVIGIFICIPAFILSGFEHSIANMFYFSAAFSFGAESILYLVIVVIGNAIGGCTIPFLQELTKEKTDAT